MFMLLVIGKVMEEFLSYVMSSLLVLLSSLLIRQLRGY